jgi:membrane associated rhomboid family serine protease
MFPLRDTVRARSFPFINIALIGFNVLVFLFENYLGSTRLDRLIELFGLIPAELSLFQPQTWITLFTSMFIHGSWFHLISNMWALFIFGDNVEDRMGHLRYFVFYILAGIVAGLVHTVVTAYFFGAESMQANLPTVGASGAIAGILGGYLILYPKARVITLVPLFILPWVIEISAYVYLGFWFLTQLFPGLLSLGALDSFSYTMSGIAWWAHIGGFLYGMLLVRLFSRPRRVYRRWYQDEYWPW